jgi:hypothetical protein
MWYVADVGNGQVSEYEVRRYLDVFFAEIRAAS